MLEIRVAETNDAGMVSSILMEASMWLESIGQPLWSPTSFSELSTKSDLSAGLYFIAFIGNDSVGTSRLQFEDLEVWPDMARANAAYLHRIAIVRRVSGMGVSSDIMEWVKSRARSLGLSYVRLDCEIRPKLCAFYEKNGFVAHSGVNVSEYFVRRYECDLTQD